MEKVYSQGRHMGAKRELREYKGLGKEIQERIQQGTQKSKKGRLRRVL